MKKLIFFLIILSVLLGFGAFYYFTENDMNPQSPLVRIPVSKPHQHATPDAELIEHTHTYDHTHDNYKLYDPSSVEEVDSNSHPIQRNWERIDLETIQKKYQPYTIDQMSKLWTQDYSNQIHKDKKSKLDKAYPPNKWLKRNLDLGQPIRNYTDYRIVLQRRMYMVNRKVLWNAAGRDGKQLLRHSLQLPDEIDTWKEYEDAFLKFWIVASYESLLSEETETVYVHIANGNNFTKFTGARLKRNQKTDLMYYGIVPEGLHVVYLDENENALPARIKPRFYEWYLKELEQGYAIVEKIIFEHKDFYISQPVENAKPKNTEKTLNIQDSFALLRDLHWDELPKDLQALQNAIRKLEVIKRQGEEKMQLQP